MKLFVWDFHGVLEQGNDNAVLEISNRVLREFGYTIQFTSQECTNLSGLKWHEYFQYLLPDEPHINHIYLQERCFELAECEPEIIAKHIKPNDNAYAVLHTIEESGHSQIVISNTKPNALTMFLKVTGLDTFFSERHAFAADAHKTNIRKTKKDILKEYIQDKKFDSFVIVGDSPSDIELGTIVNGTTYLYAHNTREFKDCAAHYKIRNLLEVLKELT